MNERTPMMLLFILFLIFASCNCVGTGYSPTQISSYAPAQPIQAVPVASTPLAPVQQNQAAPISTSFTHCTEGYHLENGQCVPDQPVACLQGHHWENGQCVPDQPVSCLQGYHLENGQCVPDQPVSCLQGYHLENGQCVPDQPVSCLQGYHLENGQCVPDQANSCVSSGGTIMTRLCCGLTGDFPNTCLIGACGCSPKNSKETKVCDCGTGKCFDGTSCVDIQNDDAAKCERNPGCVWVDGKCQCPMNGECNAGVLIQGQILSILNPCHDFQSGSACRFDVRIVKVLKGNYPNVVPGQTIVVSYTSGSQKFDAQVGDCIEVCATWDTNLYCNDNLGYVKKIECSPEPTCIPGPTGRNRCIDNKIQEEYQNSDCSYEWRTIDDCSSHNPPCQCVDGKCMRKYDVKIMSNCSIISGYKFLTNEPANWWYFLHKYPNPPPSMYYVPQTITAKVCVNHNIPVGYYTSGIAISFQIMVNKEDPNLVVTKANFVHPDPVPNQLCFGGRCNESNSPGNELQIHLKEPVIKSWYDALIKVYYNLHYNGNRAPSVDELNRDWVLAQELRIPNAFRILDDKSAGV